MRSDHARSTFVRLASWLLAAIVALPPWPSAAAQAAPRRVSATSCPQVALSAIGRPVTGKDGKLVVSLPNGQRQLYVPQGKVPVRSLKGCHADYAIRVDRLAGKCWIDLHTVTTVEQLEERLDRQPASCQAIKPQFLIPTPTPSSGKKIQGLWPGPRFDRATVARIGVIVKETDSGAGPEPGSTLKNPPPQPPNPPGGCVDASCVRSPVGPAPSPIPPVLGGAAAGWIANGLARRRRRRMADRAGKTGARDSGRVRVRDDIPDLPGN